MGATYNSIAVLFAISIFAGAQTQTVELPDSPGFVMQAATQSADSEVAAASSIDDPAGARSVTAPPSPIYPGSHPYRHRVVPADMGPQPLTSGQKLELSLRSSVTPMSFVSNFISAGWSQMNNSRPHFGTDRGAFGERLGTAKMKQAGENLMSYGLFASAFHEDPHYYVMGRSHSVKERAIYSGTRVFITRKDDGGTGVNWAKLFGLACSNALTNAYYPDQDRGATANATAFATNIGTSALSLELNEFLPDVIHAVHKKK
ncbi:MAG TPA: hypothetical protein VJU82_17935 [Acidobacteriaceae bacterium]|nr:hypothetical protein [Acidobacteriaceae bacterium]